MPSKCPECKTKSPEYHQQFAGCVPTLICYGNIDTVTTVGQAAELNAKRIGKERMAEKIHENSRKVKTLKLPQGASYAQVPDGAPFWREEGSKPLNLKEAAKDPKYKELMDTVDSNPNIKK